MSNKLTTEHVQQIKDAVRARIEEEAYSLKAQSKMNLTESEYGDGYASAQSGFSEQLFEIVDELMGIIDQTAESEENQ